jgi:hypothetical protein
MDFEPLKMVTFSFKMLGTAYLATQCHISEDQNSGIQVLFLLQVWKYLQGNQTHVGTGHADAVTAVRLSPDNRHIISGSSDGGIFRWKNPYFTQPLQESQPPTRRSSRSSLEQVEGQRGLASGEEAEENIEQAGAVTRVRNERGSKYGGNEETTGVGTFGEDGNRAKNLITKDGESTPERNGILKNGGTPKSGGTSKSIDTPERHATKSGSTPEHNCTLKSGGTSKSVDTPKRNRTPKSGGTPEHSVRLKSGGTSKSVGTPESNCVLGSVGTHKSSRTSDSSIFQNSSSMPRSNVMPKNDGRHRRTGVAQISGKQNVSNRSHKSYYI